MEYSIIKITSNRDPRLFELDITRMRDNRVRVGILHASYKNFKAGRSTTYKSNYDVFATNNFSFSTVFKGKNMTYDDIKLKKIELHEWYFERLDQLPPDIEELGIVCFK